VSVIGLSLAEPKERMEMEKTADATAAMFEYPRIAQFCF
jgi:hypothetical protein